MRFTIIMIVLIATPVATAQDLPKPSEEYCDSLELSGPLQGKNCSIVFYADLAEQRKALGQALERENKELATRNAELVEWVARVEPEPEPAVPVSPAALNPMPVTLAGTTGYVVHPGGYPGFDRHRQDGLVARYENQTGSDIRVGGTPFPPGSTFVVYFEERLFANGKRGTVSIYVEVLHQLPNGQFTAIQTGRVETSLPHGPGKIKAISRSSIR